MMGRKYSLDARSELARRLVGDLPEMGFELLDTDQVVSTHGAVIVFQVEGGGCFAVGRRALRRSNSSTAITTTTWGAHASPPRPGRIRDVDELAERIFGFLGGQRLHGLFHYQKARMAEMAFILQARSLQLAASSVNVESLAQP